MKNALAFLACVALAGCSNSPPPATPASHPPIADLVCLDEPNIDTLMIADPSGLKWDKAVREAGEDCRRALARVCRWHRDRGATVTCPESIRP
jgi:hypothetical protein